MGSLRDYVLMAPGLWDFGWAGTTDQQVPARGCTGASRLAGDAVWAVDGGLVAFRDSAFEPKCTDCLSRTDLELTAS